ncbi:YfiR family protein [Chitinimonas arctica]|uniref:YfiR family protein n=1 Tax=Chitinimonas arctica TaxID=2594795 RepID=A0A516SJL2_9NEIS|nr:YfiR family protein [Chitinimonas arctica]QDQ28337.1 YfiR family protein [Chitinimonas arctica]
MGIAARIVDWVSPLAGIHARRQDLRLPTGLFACLVYGAMLPSVTAAPSAMTAAQLKAAFIFNFSKYTQWPEEAARTDTPFFICLLNGKSETGLAILGIEGKQSQSRKLQVQVVNEAEQLKTCHIVFLEGAAGKHKAMLDGLGGAPVLTVGDGEGFIGQGGVIGLVTAGGKLGFEINLAVAKRARLRLNAQLLSLARTVQEL